jgi:hypothetical protein
VIFQILFGLVLAGVILTALALGGRDERSAAVAIILATLVTPFVQSGGYAATEIGVVLVDLGLFLVLAALALRSARFWPMWAAGFQLGALAVHAAAARLPHILPAVYAETLVIWSYPVLGALALGTWLEARDRHGHQG